MFLNYKLHLCDSVDKNPLLPLNEHAFTIDPENAQNLDDAISLVLLNTTEYMKWQYILPMLLSM